MFLSNKKGACQYLLLSFLNWIRSTYQVHETSNMFHIIAKPNTIRIFQQYGKSSEMSRPGRYRYIPHLEYHGPLVAQCQTMFVNVQSLCRRITGIELDLVVVPASCQCCFSYVWQKKREKICLALLHFFALVLFLTVTLSKRTARRVSQEHDFQIQVSFFSLFVLRQEPGVRSR